MVFGDQVIIRDGSLVDGCIGIVYRLEEECVFVLLEREVLWPVPHHSLEMTDRAPG